MNYFNREVVHGILCFNPICLSHGSCPSTVAALDSRSIGQAIDLAPGAWFITKFISLGQVSQFQYIVSAGSWPTTPFIESYIYASDVYCFIYPLIDVQLQLGYAPSIPSHTVLPLAECNHQCNGRCRGKCNGKCSVHGKHPRCRITLRATSNSVHCIPRLIKTQWLEVRLIYFVLEIS